MLTILLKKELRQMMRSFRLPGFVLLLLFFALMDPPMTKFMDKIMSSLVTDMKIVMPPPTPEMALAQFLGDIGLMGVLVLILVTMGVVANEKVTGITGWTLTRPVTRNQYLMAKLLAWAVGIVSGMAIAGFIAYMYTWSLLGPVDIADAVLAFTAMTVWMLFIGSLTVMGSVVLRSALNAGVLSIIVIFAGLSFQIFSGSSFFKYLPFSLSANSANVAHGTVEASALIPGILVTLSVTAVITLISFMWFRKLELS